MGPSLDELKWTNSVVKALAVETGPVNTRPRSVRGASFSPMKTQPVAAPKLVAVAPALRLVDIDAEEVDQHRLVEVLAGNEALPGMFLAAHCYCGFQFGYFSGQLGDGAALYLGEVESGAGRWELQLKGAGLTPFSRQADGRKVLRSSLREFLCSEAMHHLGIPTTRAGSCVVSSDTIERDQFYDPREEPLAVVSRLAPSFLRFGSFEIFRGPDPETGRAGPSAGLEQEMLPTMLEFVIKSYYPEVWAQHTSGKLALEDAYLAFLLEVTRRTARLVALWQGVGFCHGVLNTDNMSILGLTIDYGPFGFQDLFRRGHICNRSDDSGRYAYDKQPEICRWNCGKLAEALDPVLPLSKSQEAVGAAFDETYDRAYRDIMGRKLGLLKAQKRADLQLAWDLLTLMEETGADYTTTFRRLSDFPFPSAAAAARPPAPAQNGAMHSDASPRAGGPAETGKEEKGEKEEPPQASTSGRGEGLSREEEAYLESAILSALASPERLLRGLAPKLDRRLLANFKLLQQLAAAQPQMLQLMGLSAEAVRQEEQRRERLEALGALTPEAKRASDRAKWAAWLRRYRERLREEAAAGTTGAARKEAMDATNPRFVLHNWIAQQAIAAAEAGDFREARRVHALLTRPYADDAAASLPAPQPPGLRPTYDGPPPDEGLNMCMSCSS